MRLKALLFFGMAFILALSSNKVVIFCRASMMLAFWQKVLSCAITSLTGCHSESLWCSPFLMNHIRHQRTWLQALALLIVEPSPYTDVDFIVAAHFGQSSRCNGLSAIETKFWKHLGMRSTNKSTRLSPTTLQKEYSMSLTSLISSLAFVDNYENTLKILTKLSYLGR